MFPKDCFMHNQKPYIRRTISVSQFIDGTIEELANVEFGGNASAFVAHVVLHYVKCQRCPMIAEDYRKKEIPENERKIEIKAR